MFIHEFLILQFLFCFFSTFHQSAISFVLKWFDDTSGNYWLLFIHKIYDLKKNYPLVYLIHCGCEIGAHSQFTQKRERERQFFGYYTSSVVSTWRLTRNEKWMVGRGHYVWIRGCRAGTRYETITTFAIIFYAWLFCQLYMTSKLENSLTSLWHNDAFIFHKVKLTKDLQSPDLPILNIRYKIELIISNSILPVYPC